MNPLPALSLKLYKALPSTLRTLLNLKKVASLGNYF